MMNIASRCSQDTPSGHKKTFCKMWAHNNLRVLNQTLKVGAINILQLLIRKFKDHVHVTPKTLYPARSYMYNMQENYNSIILTTLWLLCRNIKEMYEIYWPSIIYSSGTYLYINWYATAHIMLYWNISTKNLILCLKYIFLGLYYHVSLPCKDARYLRSSHE